MKFNFASLLLTLLFMLPSPLFADQIDQPVTSQPVNIQPVQPYQQIQPAPVLSLIVTTTPNVDGYRVIEYKGLVRGVAVRQPTIMQGFKASFKSIVGGNIGSYEQMCEQAREKAYQMMVDKATAMGANAVLAVRFDTSAFNSSPQEMGSEVICYGTAVIITRQ